MGLPGPSKPARFEPLEWPIEIEPEELPVEEPKEAPVETPAPDREPAEV